MPPDFSAPETTPVRREATFTMDGVTLTARQPKVFTLMDLADLTDLDTEDPANLPRVLRAVESFLNDCLVADSRGYIQGRLYDPDDDFDVDRLLPVLKWLSEEFSRSRPTTPSSGSSPTRKTGGRPSTARARSGASTRQTSVPTGS